MTEANPGEGRQKEKESFKDFLNGVGMRFEVLILHVVGFFLFFIFLQLTNMTCLTV